MNLLTIVRCSTNCVSRLEAGTSLRIKAGYDFYEYTYLTAADLCSSNITVTDNCGQKCLIDFQGEYERHVLQIPCIYQYERILYHFSVNNSENHKKMISYV